MGLPDHDEFTKLPPGEPWPGQTAAPISSLHEAWFHTANRCVSDGPMNEVILPLMRNCFFGGALHAVLLLQKGYAEQLASDIAEFIREEPQL
jgi:hypothetical protein